LAERGISKIFETKNKKEKKKMKGGNDFFGKK